MERKKERKDGTLFSLSPPPFRSSRDLQHHLTLFSLFFYISFYSLSLSLFLASSFQLEHIPCRSRVDSYPVNSTTPFFFSFFLFFLFFFFCLNNRKSAKEKRKADLHRRSTRTFINFFFFIFLVFKKCRRRRKKNYHLESIENCQHFSTFKYYFILNLPPSREY